MIKTELPDRETRFVDDSEIQGVSGFTELVLTSEEETWLKQITEVIGKLGPMCLMLEAIVLPKN